ncbi:MAG TPA: dipeptidase PepE [Candidatus Angelobacter sp.]|nr:dipeptidase PepE [Candidatus Angelobacter sp.]
MDGKNTNRKLLLISSSNIYGHGYLDHVSEHICALLRGIQRVAFLPYALHNREAYAAKARQRFLKMGFTLEPVHSASEPRRCMEEAQAIFIGGGNTFRLLKALYDYDLLEVIRRRVEDGVPFIGSSAGSIVACPSLKTTKDMPVVQPPSFDALHLVEFQISPHYLDPDPASTHMGETQEERIRQYLEENDRPVVGLREPTWLAVEGGAIVLRGSTTARIFRRERDPVEISPGANVTMDLAVANGSKR